MNREEKILAQLALLVLFACFMYPISLWMSMFPTSRETRPDELQTETYKRMQNQTKLNSSSPCAKPSMDDFPRDFMTPYQRQKQGGVVIHFLLAIYMLIALSLVCDVYFVPSLEQITKKFHMNSDVSGATFMAIGTSAPELFTAFIGIFITSNDIGFGTILGSVQFNTVFIVAVCGLFAGTVLRLRPWPLLRDCSCYLLSIAALVAVTYDKKVYWYEAMVLVTMYLLYVVIMYFNTTFESCFNQFTRTNECDDTDVEKGANEQSSLLEDKYESSTHMSTLSRSEKEEKEEQEEIQIIDQMNYSPFSVPRGFLSKTLWVVALPVTCLLYVTIPDCRKERWERWYLVSFLVSVVWIALFSYVLVWMVSIIGFTLEIPDVVMSFTFLAAGTSVPEALSSLIVARKGEGNMAVSHAVASNPFDILFGLGLPWFLKTTVVAKAQYVVVQNSAMIYTSILLIGSLFVVILLIKVNRWYLNKCLGITFSIFYLGFTAGSIYFAYVFGDDLPMCTNFNQEL